jgi:predicted phage terminase large subunit-like protein
MMTDRRRLFRALLRQDLSTFVEKVFSELEPGTGYQDNWHIHHLCWQLSRVARGELSRLIINVPPRSLKSITVSVAFTAWLLGNAPANRIICVSYAEDLARKHSIDTRRVLESDWFQEAFPALVLARRRDLELATTLQGYRFASGVGGAVLGRGADVIVIDDPIKALDALSEAERRRVAEFYDNTLVTRLNDKRTGAIVVVAQRLHQDDLIGHVLEKEDWEVVSLPAIATEDRSYQLSDDPQDTYMRMTKEVLHERREPMEVLDQIRRAQGSLLFSAQYQQQPISSEGNIIKREWLRYYERPPSSYERVIVSWDTASTTGSTSDWSVGTVWGTQGLDFYLIDVVRERLEFPALRHRIIELHNRYKAHATLIEETELGRVLCQDLRAGRQLRPIMLRPQFGKEARFLIASSKFEGGQVHLPREAQWFGAYLEELMAFPNARHDDQVDSTSQALNWLTARASRRPPAVRVRGFGSARNSYSSLEDQLLSK